MITGKVIKYGDNVNTDVIMPGEYMDLTLNPTELAKHAMEDLDSAFAKKVKTRTIVVGGKNFGCGSSREEAPMALKYAGVKCVVADSFARIFFRNAINIGLPVMECPDVSTKIDDEDKLIVDPSTGAIRDQTKNLTLQATRMPIFILEILNDGGLIEHLRKGMKMK